MKGSVLFFCLCGPMLCHAAESAADSAQLRREPFLHDLAWQVFKTNADRYRSIERKLKSFIDDQLEKRESLEDDPFAYLCLADQLQADGQKERAAKYIAMQLFQSAPGRQQWENRRTLTNDFRVAYTDLVRRLFLLPDHLSGLIQKLRNEINDVTGRFEGEDQPAAQAE